MAEAQACGKPVIAYNKGGATEIIRNGETGILIRKQNVKELKEAVRLMENTYENFKHDVIKENAKKFSETEFENDLNNFIKEILENKISYNHLQN